MSNDHFAIVYLYIYYQNRFKHVFCDSKISDWCEQAFYSRVYLAKHGLAFSKHTNITWNVGNISIGGRDSYMPRNRLSWIGLHSETGKWWESLQICGIVFRWCWHCVHHHSATSTKNSQRTQFDCNHWLWFRTRVNDWIQFSIFTVNCVHNSI